MIGYFNEKGAPNAAKRSTLDAALKGHAKFITLDQMKEATSTKKMTLHLNGHTCQCTCEIYLKEYQCEHLLALGILYGVYNCPVEAKNVPLGQKRKPGRPAKAKKSLVRQE